MIHEMRRHFVARAEHIPASGAADRAKMAAVFLALVTAGCRKMPTRLAHAQYEWCFRTRPDIPPLAAGVMTLVLAAASLTLLACLWFIGRLYVVVRSGPAARPGAEGPVSVLVVAGSGGHTTEILRLMGSLSAAYTPRHYVIADTDRMSEEKICSFESSKHHSHQSQFTIYRIPRSREVQQSWSSSVCSTLSALWYSIPLIYRLRPDVVLCNGPGTCVPLCMAGLLLGILGMKKVLIVYIESICRVETLSLTGKILYHFSDYFFVQWSSLRDKYPKATFLGRIV